MTTFQRSIAVLVTLWSVSMLTSAYADQAPTGGTAFVPHQHSDPVINVEKRLAQLKSELHITSDQQMAWNTYADDTTNDVRDIRDQMNAAMNDTQQSAPKRFDHHIELMRQRLAIFVKMDAALKQFYATLSPAQQAIADAHFSQIHH